MCTCICVTIRIVCQVYTLCAGSMQFEFIIRYPTYRMYVMPVNCNLLCLYSVFVSSLTAGLTEFQKRAQFITGSHHHVFEPLMKRCLSEQPVARGTFEDVRKDLSVHQSKYGGKQAQKLEEQIVRHPYHEICETACTG